jgi:hypothetical protein
MHACVPTGQVQARGCSTGLTARWPSFVGIDALGAHTRMPQSSRRGLGREHEQPRSATAHQRRAGRDAREGAAAERWRRKAVTERPTRSPARSRRTCCPLSRHDRGAIWTHDSHLQVAHLDQRCRLRVDAGFDLFRRVRTPIAENAHHLDSLGRLTAPGRNIADARPA